MDNKLKIILCAEEFDLTSFVDEICNKYKTVSAKIDDIDINNKIELFETCDAVFVLSNNYNISPIILNKWTGHPHLRCVISNDDKSLAAGLFAEIDSLLNNIELEKKYLITIPDFNQLVQYHPFTVDIEQVYLNCDNGSHRIRKRGVAGEFSYFETRKVRITNDKCFEYENKISSYAYEELKLNANPKKHPIIKKRTCFVYKGQYFELDTFDFFNGKALLELELRDENQNFELPPEIEVIKDVSNKKKYKNNYLAGITNYDNY